MVPISDFKRAKEAEYHRFRIPCIQHASKPQQWTSKSIDWPTRCEEKPTTREAQSRQRQASQGIPHFRQSYDPKRDGTSYHNFCCIYQRPDPFNFGEENVPKDESACHRSSRYWAAANPGPTVLPPDQLSPIRIFFVDGWGLASIQHESRPG